MQTPTHLFFDTETTGLPRSFSAPVTDTANWPRIVELAWILTTDTGRMIEQASYIIAPPVIDGRPEYSIPDQAADVHGITTQFARKHGSPIGHVLKQFYLAAKKTSHFVAHNLSFDRAVLACEYHRANIDCPITSKHSLICTKELTTDFCAIPSNHGYKWPQLQELHQKLFNCEFKGAHAAMTDVRATAKCFFKFQSITSVQ